MTTGGTISVCILNISANPHPEGIYRRLLTAASNIKVSARGSDFAKITKPFKHRNKSIYTGRIILATELALDEPWLDENSDDELSEETMKSIRENLPVNAKPNFRVFNYAFDEKNHLFYYESRNEFGKSLGPTTARKILSKLLSPDVTKIDGFDVSVTIIPEQDRVKRILKSETLKSLYISISIPNPDNDPSDSKKRVFDRMKRTNSKRLEQKFTKASEAEHLIPDDEMKDMALVGAEYGLVEGEVKDENGRTIKISTSDTPRILHISLESGDSFIERISSKVGTLG